MTGKRGGFGALIRVMQLIDADPDMEFNLIVTDMHLSPKFGETVNEVEKWFKISHRIDLEQVDDSGFERAKALGRCVTKMSEALNDIKPDILLTLGDRGEVLSACIAALEQNIPIAHILGGDLAGNRDGMRIHAISKLAHLHFPSSQDAADRIARLGEEGWRINNFGATYVENIVQKKYTPNSEVREKYGIGVNEKYAICIHHPITLREDDSYGEAKAVFEALNQSGLKVITIYPCSDQGYEGVLKAMDEYKNLPNFDVYKNIEAVDFWGLQSGAEFMIGNSSSGLIEAPYFELPTVNVGKRQDGRVRDNNVIDVEPSITSIKEGIEKALSEEFRQGVKNNFIFGDGYASSKIVRTLKNVEINDRLIIKKMRF